MVGVSERSSGRRVRLGRTPPAKGSGCRRAAASSSGRPMLPTALAPLDPHKTRALTTIYAPRKLKVRKNKTAQSRMIDEIPVKPTLSPFHPLPAIGQKLERSKTKIIVFDLNKHESDPVKIHEVLKPLTPLRIQGFARKKPLDLNKRPHQLLRENTYDVIEPIYYHPSGNEKDNESRPPDKQPIVEETTDSRKVSPKTRFKNAAMKVAKLSSMPETGKLLCLREKETFSISRSEDRSCKLERLPRSPEQKLDKLSEIFQTLDMKGRHRDKLLKKENSWF